MGFEMIEKREEKNNTETSLAIEANTVVFCCYRFSLGLHSRFFKKKSLRPLPALRGAEIQYAMVLFSFMVKQIGPAFRML